MSAERSARPSRSNPQHRVTWDSHVVNHVFPAMSKHSTALSCRSLHDIHQLQQLQLKLSPQQTTVNPPPTITVTITIFSVVSRIFSLKNTIKFISLAMYNFVPHLELCQYIEQAKKRKQRSDTRSFDKIHKTQRNNYVDNYTPGFFYLQQNRKSVQCFDSEAQKEIMDSFQVV